MEIIHATENNFKDLLQGYTLVDFFATWCGPCKMLGQVLENVQDKIKIVKVDIDECENLAREYGVMSVPTLFLMKDGVIVSQKIGFVPEPLLISWIEENK